jgi:hypothetical protein
MRPGQAVALGRFEDHIVLLHDVSGLRYCGELDPDGDYPLWSGGRTERAPREFNPASFTTAHDARALPVN